MQAFSFATTAQILCEAGSAIRLAELCRERRARRVLIVTDPGITRLGLLDAILPGFPRLGLAVEVYDQVPPIRPRRWSRPRSGGHGAWLPSWWSVSAAAAPWT